MAKAIIEDNILADIADEINLKKETNVQYKDSELAQQIREMNVINSNTVISIANGGTGATTKEQARQNLGIPEFPLSIANGGTGATTKEQARQNLGIPEFPFVAGTTAPLDKTRLWIDTTPKKGGLKYFNGASWVYVPVSYT